MIFVEGLLLFYFDMRTMSKVFLSDGGKNPTCGWFQLDTELIINVCSYRKNRPNHGCNNIQLLNMSMNDTTLITEEIAAQSFTELHGSLSRCKHKLTAHTLVGGRIS
jgi:hypothetical protein